MSTASKLTLTGTSITAAAIVVFVHYQQQREKAVSSSAGKPFLGANVEILSGNAQRSSQGYGATAGEERETSGF